MSFYHDLEALLPPLEDPRGALEELRTGGIFEGTGSHNGAVAVERGDHYVGVEDVSQNFGGSPEPPWSRASRNRLRISSSDSPSQGPSSRNVKEYDNGVTAWFYRTADGGGAAVFYQKRGGQLKVYKTDYNAVD